VAANAGRFVPVAPGKERAPARKHGKQHQRCAAIHRPEQFVHWLLIAALPGRSSLGLLVEVFLSITVNRVITTRPVRQHQTEQGELFREKPAAFTNREGAHQGTGWRMQAQGGLPVLRGQKQGSAHHQQHGIAQGNWSPHLDGGIDEARVSLGIFSTLSCRAACCG